MWSEAGGLGDGRRHSACGDQAMIGPETDWERIGSDKGRFGGREEQGRDARTEHGGAKAGWADGGLD